MYLRSSSWLMQILVKRSRLPLAAHLRLGRNLAPQRRICLVLVLLLAMLIGLRTGYLKSALEMAFISPAIAHEHDNGGGWSQLRKQWAWQWRRWRMPRPAGRSKAAWKTIVAAEMATSATEPVALLATMAWEAAMPPRMAMASYRRRGCRSRKWPACPAIMNCMAPRTTSLGRSC